MARKSNIKDFIQWILFGFLIAIAATYFFLDSDENHSLSAQPTIELAVNGKPNSLPVISKVAPFTLTNHLGNPFTETNVLGNPWLANIIFTRCPTVCPKITQTLSQLRLKLPDQLNYISLTTDPSFDTPEKLKAFAEANGSNETNWHFLTGPKATLMTLAIEDLKLISIPTEKSNRKNPGDLFVHSSLYILVDSKGQVRASFEHDATNLVQMIQKALETLEKDL